MCLNANLLNDPVDREARWVRSPAERESPAARFSNLGSFGQYDPPPTRVYASCVRLSRVPVRADVSPISGTADPDATANLRLLDLIGLDGHPTSLLNPLNQPLLIEGCALRNSQVQNCELPPLEEQVQQWA